MKISSHKVRLFWMKVQLCFLKPFSNLSLKNKLCYEIKNNEYRMWVAFETPEERRAIGQEPIRNLTNYQDLGRRFLTVDGLPEGAYARYERAVNSITRPINGVDEHPGPSFYENSFVYSPYTPIYVSNMMGVVEAVESYEDRVFCDYLHMLKVVKEERWLEDLKVRNDKRNAIMWLEIE